MIMSRSGGDEPVNGLMIGENPQFQLVVRMGRSFSE
jgi:hypothetical protein